MTEEFKNEQIKSAMKLNDINFEGYRREDEEYIDLQSFLRPKTAAIYEHELEVRREKLEEVMNGYIGGFIHHSAFPLIMKKDIFVWPLVIVLSV